MTDAEREDAMLSRASACKRGEPYGQVQMAIDVEWLVAEVRRLRAELERAYDGLRSCMIGETGPGYPEPLTWTTTLPKRGNENKRFLVEDMIGDQAWVRYTHSFGPEQLAAFVMDDGNYVWAMDAKRWAGPIAEPVEP